MQLNEDNPYHYKNLLETKKVSCVCPRCGGKQATRTVEVWQKEVYDPTTLASEDGSWGDSPYEFGYGLSLATVENEVSHNGVVIVDCPHCEVLYEDSRDTLRDAKPLILQIDIEVVRYLATHPDSIYSRLSSRAFEELVAAILKDMGFDVELTPATRDGGVDIYAYLRNRVASFLMLVECKKLRPDRPVSVSVVQRLYGVQQSLGANKSMLVTTSHFSAPAIQQSREYKQLMELKNYDDLKAWLAAYLHIDPIK